MYRVGASEDRGTCSDQRKLACEAGMATTSECSRHPQLRNLFGQFHDDFPDGSMLGARMQKSLTTPQQAHQKNQGCIRSAMGSKI
eukprot:scaffold320223_cov27-Tisochrysis_lutea.AAC.2